MQSLFDKIGKTASSAASLAANKAEEVMEVNKLKGEQNDLKNEYAAVKRKLADYVFKQYQAKEITDETLIEFCEKMQELRDGIDDIDEEIKAVKEEYRAKAAESSEERI